MKLVIVEACGHCILLQNKEGGCMNEETGRRYMPLRISNWEWYCGIYTNKRIEARKI